MVDIQLLESSDLLESLRPRVTSVTSHWCQVGQMLSDTRSNEETQSTKNLLSELGTLSKYFPKSRQMGDVHPGFEFTKKQWQE